MPTIDLSVQIPPLPAGWQGTPDDLLQFLQDNGVFQMDGEALAGQIGGSRPVQDTGVWFGDESIERYINGKYRPISDVPIGLVSAFAGSTAPSNYLLCQGQSVLRADYPELYAVIGVDYGTESGTTFTIPDLRGRVPTGAGIGDYIKQGFTGKMREVIRAQYSGLESIRATPPAPGAPSALRFLPNQQGVTSFVAETFPPRVGMNYIIRYR